MNSNTRIVAIFSLAAYLAAAIVSPAMADSQTGGKPHAGAPTGKFWVQTKGVKQGKSKAADHPTGSYTGKRMHGMTTGKRIHKPLAMATGKREHKPLAMATGRRIHKPLTSTTHKGPKHTGKNISDGAAKGQATE